MDKERNLPYTICFCKVGEMVLMLYRNNSPNKDKWNGLGGKILAGETHQQANIREIEEESGIDLNQATSVRFTGLVTWDVYRDNESYKGGMYAYIAEFDDKNIIFGIRETREGKLEWKELSWVVDEKNLDVVENIRFFLPQMLDGNELFEYRFIYRNDELVASEVHSLSNFEENEK